MVEGETQPIIDIVRDMAARFKDEFGVPLEAIEKYIGCKSEAFSMNNLIRLKKVYVSLRDGMAKREDYFEISLPAETEGKDNEVKDPFAGKENDTKKDENKEEVNKNAKKDNAKSR